MTEAFNRVITAAAGSLRSDSLRPRSALGSAPHQRPQTILDSDRLCIVEEPLLTIISLRQSRRQPDYSAVSNWLRPLGLSLPSTANGLSGNEQLGCCWFEPQAWLVTGAVPAAPGAPEAGVLATTISDRLAAFRLTGPAAAQVIAAGCDPSIVRTMRCARTRFAGFATVLIQRWGDEDYRLLIDVSLARSFAGWLKDTAKATEIS